MRPHRRLLGRERGGGRRLGEAGREEVRRILATVPIHDGATTDPGKLHRLLSSLCPAGPVQPLRPGVGEAV